MRAMSPRGWLIFLGLGAAGGLILGLLFSWVILPVRYVDTEPRSLREDYRTAHLALIARAWAATGDLERARERLSAFPDEGNAEALAALAQQTLASGGSEDDARALASLAAALDVDFALATATPTVAPLPTTAVPLDTPAPSSTPAVAGAAPSRTPRLRPSRTPTATPGGIFHLASREEVCRPELAAPLIQVIAENAAGEPLPGIEFLVEWNGGSDHFFTGLKPELGEGYGDFEMTVGVTYSVRTAGQAKFVADLQAPACKLKGIPQFAGSLLLTFQLSE